MGLGKGGNLENAIVVKGNSLINEEGLRNEKEFVNHKILDCMGDLYLSGFKIIGSLTCSQGGHHLTNKLLRKLFSDKNNYSLIEIKGKKFTSFFSNQKSAKINCLIIKFLINSDKIINENSFIIFNNIFNIFS